MQPQRAAGDGRPAAPRPRRPRRGRARRRGLPARDRARRGRRPTPPRAPRPRRGGSTRATTPARPRPRGGARRLRAELLPAAGDWAAPHRARLEEARATLLETRAAARLRLGEDVVGELEAAVAAAPVPGAAVGAVDHRAVWRGPSGRRARRLPTRPRPARRRPRARARPRPARPRAAGPRARPGAAEPRPPAAGNLPSLRRARRPRRRARRLAGCSPATASSRSSAPAASARPRSPSPPAGRSPRRRAASGSRGSRAPHGRRGARHRRRGVRGDRRRGGAPRAGPARRRAARARQLRARRSTRPPRSPSACSTPRPALRILATSQAALDVDGEALFELAPLALADAVELFTRRATRAGDPDEVHELCRALDGLPLAIELAAARTRTLPVEEIARRLDDRFAVLHDPTSRKPERRRALRATIGWSYDLLFPDDQRGLWALAAFSGGAPLAGASSRSSRPSTCRRPRRST